MPDFENIEQNTSSSINSLGLDELKVSESNWKERSLEDKIEYVKDIDSKIDEIQGKTGLSKDEIFNAYFPEIETIWTKQSGWDGKTINEVKYTMQPFVSSTGKVYRGVFPEFPVKYEIRLPEYCMSDKFWDEYGNRSDRMQMKYATIGLKEELIKNPSLKETLNLSDRQYTDIMAEKDKIEGLTWHHDINFGRMKLIDEKVHSFKEHQHSGGMATWNDRWIQSHLIDISKLENVTDYMEADRHICGKLTIPELEYVGEILPLENTDLIIARIDELDGRRPPKAIDSDRAVAELIEPVRNKIDSLYLEAPSDNIQVEAISDVMTQVEGLEYDKWKTLSFDKRMEVLQQLENEVAQIAHRPPCIVVSQNLGEGHLGFYEQGSNCITINENYIKSTDCYDAVLDTLIHEGRHAYQDYNLNVRETHPRHGDISNWNLNELHGYQDVEHCGFKAYQLQPVESDARAFAEDVLNHYQDKIA